MAFGDRLAEVRRGHGLTQEQFAEQLQVSRQAVSKWESGRGYPEIEKILYLLNAVFMISGFLHYFIEDCKIQRHNRNCCTCLSYKTFIY